MLARLPLSATFNPCFGSRGAFSFPFLAELFFVVFLAISCGGNGSSSSGATSSANTQSYAPLANTGNILVDDGLQIKTYILNSGNVETTLVDKGEVVTLVLEVTNTTGSDKSITFGSPHEYDFMVYDSGGQSIWKFPSGLALAVLVTKTLQAGGAFTYKYSWNSTANDGSTLASGAYTLKGIFLRIPQNRSSEYNFLIK